MTRGECQAEILRLYKGYTPQYTWPELDEILTHNEGSGRTMKYSRPPYWWRCEGAENRAHDLRIVRKPAIVRTPGTKEEDGRSAATNH